MGWKIERVGKVTGRWPSYEFIVNGVSLGRVKKTLTGGGDRMTPTVRYSGWAIHGLSGIESREKAENILIEKAIRFGYLKE